MKHPFLSRQLARLSYAGFLTAVISTPALGADLTITVPEVANSEGEILVAIYNSAEAFEKEELLSALRSKSVSGDMTFTFNNLEAGEYAVQLYHDLNGNGKLDTNLLGIPREPWGASLQGKRLFRAPSWEDLRFVMSAEDLALTINLN